jgi:hypothetical protein
MGVFYPVVEAKELSAEFGYTTKLLDGLNSLLAKESGARYYANQSTKITATMPAKS